MNKRELSALSTRLKRLNRLLKDAALLASEFRYSPDYELLADEGSDVRAVVGSIFQEKLEADGDTPVDDSVFASEFDDVVEMLSSLGFGDF